MTQISKGIMYSNFFDSNNIDYIHNTLIETVYKVTNGKYNIERQSDIQLNIIMTRIHNNNAPYSEDPSMIAPQLKALNRELITKCMKLILTELKQREHYLTKEIDGDGNRINTDPTRANMRPVSNSIVNQLIYPADYNQGLTIVQDKFDFDEVVLVTPNTSGYKY